MPSVKVDADWEQIDVALASVTATGQTGLTYAEPSRRETIATWLTIVTIVFCGIVVALTLRR